VPLPRLWQDHDGIGWLPPAGSGRTPAWTP